MPFVRNMLMVTPSLCRCGVRACFVCFMFIMHMTLKNQVGNDFLLSCEI